LSAARHCPLDVELAALPLFDGLTPDQLRWVARVAARVQEPKGEVLTKEGERGDELMIVLEGTVEVRHDGHVLATLGRGDFFGEVALLEAPARRTATAVAVTRVTIVFIGRHDLVHLLAEMPVLADRITDAAHQRRMELEQR
jgi:CRP-like cAMP-binding protein